MFTNHLFVYHMQLNKDDAHNNNNNNNNNIVLPILGPQGATWKVNIWQ